MYRSVGKDSQSLIVRDNNESLPELVAKVEKELMEFGFVLGIETSRWLVSKNNRWFVHQGSSHCHTLLFATRKFVRLMFGTVGKTEEVEQFFSTFFGFLLTPVGNE